MTIDDHNAARWLVVRWLEATRLRRTAKEMPAGWYVVRICPCHFNLPVQEIPCESESDARRVMAKLVAVPPELAENPVLPVLRGSYRKKALA